MNNFIKKIAPVALCAIAFSALLANAAPAPRDIIVGARNGFQGVAYVDENGNYTGLEAEVLKRVFKELPQYKFEIRYLEQRSLFPSLLTNKVDMVQGNLRRNEVREKNAIRTRVAHNWTPYVITVPQANTQIHSLADLEGKRIAQNKNSGQAGIMEQYIKSHNANIEIVYSPEMLTLLADGQVDAVISPVFNVPQFNAVHKNYKLKYVGEPVGGVAGTPDNDPNAYFWFRPDDKQLRDDVSAVIAQLRADGTLSRLSRQFLSEDYPARIDLQAEKNLTQ
ncbi:transporter substrate-binding domain-containing protein [Sodalis sp. RH22]|uniref:transporter substrate-binding domain-containing protein n=1 Tax=unclassified Sodalis (in: enterobacteria) TaxID=2636512 RepID=UPI0039B661C9